MNNFEKNGRFLAAREHCGVLATQLTMPSAASTREALATAQAIVDVLEPIVAHDEAEKEDLA